MIENLVIGSVNLCVTVFIHGAAMLITTRSFRRWMNAPNEAHLLIELFRVTFVVIVLFVATPLETLWWAASYVYLGVLQSLEPALYFSMVTYTTLGYGDITLDEQWRLLSAFQAVNGLVIAGWSTALLFALIQKVYFAHHPESRL